jgi:putative ABC transport system ATP-binding protein
VEIFKNLDLEIPSGDFIALVGPSGSGKSTFLNMMSGIDRNYQGSISVFGKEIQNLSDDEMTAFRGKNISYIFQNFKLIDNLSVEENVDLMVELNGLERNFSTAEILEIVGLTKKAKMSAFHLSG